MTVVESLLNRSDPAGNRGPSLSYRRFGGLMPGCGAHITSRRLPPYAREVIAARRAGETNVHVHVGISAWYRASKWGRGHRVVVPLDLDHSLEDYNFRFLQDLAVTVNAIDADLILAQRVAFVIAEHGAALAVLLHPALPGFSEHYYAEAK